MKFDWGTGILIFLILFLLACAIFIGFAMRQDVNLVHEDYYEKGVDHTRQMNAEARSIEYQDSILAHFDEEFLIVDFKGIREAEIDSGNILFYRPSSSSLDMNIPFGFSGSSMKIQRTNLIRGRYVLKFTWYSEGLKFNIDKAIEVP